MGAAINAAGEYGRIALNIVSIKGHKQGLLLEYGTTTTPVTWFYIYQGQTKRNEETTSTSLSSIPITMI